jgi:hypothetical protein
MTFCFDDLPKAWKSTRPQLIEYPSVFFLDDVLQIRCVLRRIYVNAGCSFIAGPWVPRDDALSEVEGRND